VIERITILPLRVYARHVDRIQFVGFYGEIIDENFGRSSVEYIPQQSIVVIPVVGSIRRIYFTAILKSTLST
jgi:hypothetical protein